MCWRTWVGLTLIWDVPRLVGRYCSYLLPKQAGGTPQIKVNPTQVRHQMCHPVFSLYNARQTTLPSLPPTHMHRANLP